MDECHRLLVQQVMTELMAKYDTSGDGNVDYYEFCRTLGFSATQ
jgi:Ca2+-binding EF-hand superfamily protein